MSRPLPMKRLRRVDGEKRREKRSKRGSGGWGIYKGDEGECELL